MALRSSPYYSRQVPDYSSATFACSPLCGLFACVTQLNTPCIYAAPEIIFHDHISPAVDVWALAVLIHMVLSGGFHLFNSYRGIQKEVLREMVLTLDGGPSGEDRSEYFDKNATFIGNKTKLPPMSGKLLKIPSDRMEGEELEELERVIHMMVSYGITDRISAAEVVRLTPDEERTGPTSRRFSNPSQKRILRKVLL